MCSIKQNVIYLNLKVKKRQTKLSITKKTPRIYFCIVILYLKLKYFIQQCKVNFLENHHKAYQSSQMCNKNYKN